MSIPAQDDSKLGDERLLTFTQYVVREVEESAKKYPHQVQLVNLITSLQTAVKVISGVVRRAGCERMVGAAGDGDSSINIQGEEQQKLDIYANNVLINMLRTSYATCFVVSEELENVVETEPERSGDFVVFFDPLDGSNNIDCLCTIGTIFAIYLRKTDPKTEAPSLDKDVLQTGREAMVAAGYVLYGSATKIVFTMGHGVHGFTYDPSIAEFLLTHKFIRVPSGPNRPRRQYSTNEGYRATWDPRVVAFIDEKKQGDEPFSQRYIGTFIADFHRTLMYGGIFLYPANADSPRGKLRLLYECNPASFIMEQAGGLGIDGEVNILDKKPKTIHDRTQVFLGSPDEIERLQYFLQTPVIQPH